MQLNGATIKDKTEISPCNWLRGDIFFEAQTVRLNQSTPTHHLRHESADKVDIIQHQTETQLGKM